MAATKKNAPKKEKKQNLRNAEGVSRGELYTIDPRRIYIDWSKNPRDGQYDEDYINNELIPSIKLEGVKDPIRVMDTTEVDADGKPYACELSQGYTRMTSVHRILKEDPNFPIKLKAIKVTGNEDDILFDHFSLNSGKDLPLLAKAKAYKTLIGRGFTIAEIGQRITKSYSVIANTLKLCSVPKRIENLMREGVITNNFVLAVLNKAENVNDAVTVIDASVEKWKIDNAEYLENIEPVDDVVNTTVVTDGTVSESVEGAVVAKETKAVPKKVVKKEKPKPLTEKNVIVPKNVVWKKKITKAHKIIKKLQDVEGVSDHQNTLLEVLIDVLDIIGTEKISMETIEQIESCLVCDEGSYEEFIEKLGGIEKEIEVGDTNPKTMKQIHEADVQHCLFTLNVDDDNNSWWFTKGIGNNVARYIITALPYEGDDEITIQFN